MLRPNFMYQWDLILSLLILLCFSFRIRLRKKSWKSPVKIYTDNCIFDRDIKVTFNLEFFVEIVSGIYEVIVFAGSVFLV